ncbi:MAG TPA: type IV toxin-antitoxin system AbiEi family antitoxin [Thermoplasmata archaeon]|nr:type IV toxin-antitoxin system AbiEi family antitoxin [Thermoplasmata archaeon]
MEARSLSRVEARIVLSLEAEGVVEVTLDEIEGRARVSRGFARKLAHALVQKGWLQRVARGRYLLNPARHGAEAIPDTDPFRLGARIARPYYFGFATAAELLGLLPQASRVYYVATPARSAARILHAAQFRRVHVDPSRFFGTREIVRRGERLVVSDVERTILDCLDRPDLSGGLGGVARILESAEGRIRWERLHVYLGRLGQRSLALRLGFLAERVLRRRPPPARWVRRTLPRPTDPYVPLGAPREFGRRGPHDARWRIIRNVPDSVLFAEVDLR